MKSGNIIKTAILGAAFVVAVGCNDAEFGTIENSIFISEAAPSGAFRQQVENLLIDGDVQTAIHVRIAQPVSYDVKATLDYAPEFVEEYNNTNGTTYSVLPSEYLSFDKQAVIKAGSISSENININVAEFPTDSGEAYCIPIKIASCDAPFGITDKSSRMLYLLTAPNKQVVPAMTYAQVPASGIEHSQDDAWGVATSEWTLEGWVQMSAFPINNQAIFNGSVSQGTEIYVRFGDAAIPYNQLQIKTGGSQVESNTLFQAYTWYHIAFTYANGHLTVYVNGDVDVEKDFAATDYVINGLQLCSSGSTYFRATARMAQVRFWKKALTQANLKDGMSRNISADSEGLIGYWKLNEGEGSIYYDSSPNGRDMYLKSAPSWGTVPVNFLHPND